MQIHITVQENPNVGQEVPTLCNAVFEFTSGIATEWSDGRMCANCLDRRSTAEYRRATKVFAFAVDSTVQPRRPQDVLIERFKGWGGNPSPL